MQPHYNLLNREEEREMLPLCQAEGVGVLPWSPLARGRLTRPWDERGSTERGTTDEYGKGLYRATEEADKQVADRLGELSKARGLPKGPIGLGMGTPPTCGQRAHRRRDKTPSSRDAVNVPCR
jgi:aryl-alcohol dehydrogenase-like predicted oxidoreductase